MLKTILSFVVITSLGVPLQAQPTVSSPTEGIITHAFVPEHEMQAGLQQMLARFATYLKQDYQDADAVNSRGEAYGCFRSNSTMQSNEDGVRSNADLGMVCAFLCRYGRGQVSLPAGVSWEDMEQMALRSLVYAYSTHKANRLAACADNSYWGSTSARDNQWESNLWAMSVAYSAFFLWDKLSDRQRDCIERLLKAECNYELERTVPTGYEGDTKAEENGWDACVLAATIGLFPHDKLAPQWFERLRTFAINAYSHPNDAHDTTIVDPHYDTKTVGDLYLGPNLYPDYTLQNHNYFHTSYQNVVIQELGEAALAMKLFQTALHGGEKWTTRALMHNNEAVQREVLNWLALADGELAMPNGNDWSLFLYDQITSYTTNATFLKDPDALMLENLAYKMIQARQTTTDDGSWLLRSDIGARRMGVEAHRVMMTWLMHHLMPTASMQPTDFETFRRRHETARIFESQNIVRAYTQDRFTTFSWAPGIKSYTGYIAANSPDKNKVIVPYKAHNTGNFLGWYTVEGRRTNARPIVSGNYMLDGTAWTMNGELLTNDSTLDHRFAIYSTPGNAVIYLDDVKALRDVTITGERGGLMAISTDEFTRRERTLYHAAAPAGTMQELRTDGTTLQTINTDWVNIDNVLGIVGSGDKKMAFGDRADNNSIMTSKLYATWSDSCRRVEADSVVDVRHVVYYSNVTASTTQQMSNRLKALRGQLPEGWNGVIACDPDQTEYLLLANFRGMPSATLEHISTAWGAPVYCVETDITDSRSTATFTTEPNHAVSQVIRFYIKGQQVRAIAHGNRLTLTAPKHCKVTISSPGCRPIILKMKPHKPQNVSKVRGRLKKD
ncbi:MAG: hypothetical protein I3J02_02035 [Prevotella sp.]|nr:hypothetical protein [Prevotella sp.]